MRRIAQSALAVLWTPLLLAQGEVQGQKADQPSEAQAAYQKLVSGFEAARDANGVATRAMIQTAEYKAAAKNRDRDAINALRATVTPIPIDEIRAQFQAEAENYAGEEDAIRFLTWIALNGRDADATKDAVATLVHAHLGSDALVDLASGIGRLSRMLGAELQAEATELLEQSPHKMVRANAMFSRAQLVLRDRQASESDKGAALATLREVTELADGTDLALEAGAPLFEIERLQIGMVAPDIVAEDLDGTPFKLSDYRGKVVVLDFWGDW